VGIWVEDTEKRYAINEEKETIILWFNSLTDIRKSKAFPGGMPVPDAGIVIHLKSGDEVSVVYYSGDVKVQSSKKGITYWGEQSELNL
jgi:hypothetical protein